MRPVRVEVNRSHLGKDEDMGVWKWSEGIFVPIFNGIRDGLDKLFGDDVVWVTLSLAWAVAWILLI